MNISQTLTLFYIVHISLKEYSAMLFLLLKTQYRALFSGRFKGTGDANAVCSGVGGSLLALLCRKSLFTWGRACAICVAAICGVTCLEGTPAIPLPSTGEGDTKSRGLWNNRTQSATSSTWSPLNKKLLHI